MRKFHFTFICILFYISSLSGQNHCLKLNGLSDYVTLPDLDLTATNNLTLEANIYSDGLQKPWSGILIFTGFRSGLMLRNNNELGYMWEDSHGNRYTWSSGLIVPTDKWCYVALVVSPGSVTVYLNQSSATHSIANDAKDITGFSYLGTDRAVSNRYFKGYIDEVRIWNISRSDSEIRANMSKRLNGTEAGLKAYFKMDDKASSLTDNSPNLYTGMLTGTAYVANNGFVCPAFRTNKTLIKVGDNITFTDLSCGYNAINSWKWVFTGPENSISYDQNPSVNFRKEGSYDVKLVVSDGITRDSIIKQAYIMAANPIKFDSLFFVQKKSLLTATWKTPFAYKDVITRTVPSGPYMGNGDVGIATTTANNSQTIRISKVDFMTDNVQYFDWLAAAPSHLPVGGVKINVNSPITSGFNYEMDILGNELRMTTATANPVKMKSWMAVDDNIIITELSTTSVTPVSISVETFADSATVWYATTSAINGEVAQVSRQSKTDNTSWVSKAGISTKVIGASPVLSIVSNARILSGFTLSSSQPVTILTYVSGGGKVNDAKLNTAFTRLIELNQDSVLRLLSTKTTWWKDMWQRSYVETNDDLLNRHYLSSIYQLASAHNLHSPTCGGMYGVWNMSDSMMYNGDIHLNYNSQAGFYSSFSSNRQETALPFLNLIYSAIPQGQLRAKTDMGKLHSSWNGKSCNGILFPVSMSSLGDLFGSYWSQTMDAPFNVCLFGWYFDYTGDVDFLRNKAYPFIKQCGDFYESFIKKETVGNTYRYTLTCATHEGGWNLNPPADLGLMQQTFTLLLKYSKVLDIDTNKRAIWSDILNHCPNYATHLHNGLKVFAKDEAGLDKPNHMIQMHTVYPAEILTFNSNPDTLQIAKNTVDYFCVEKDAFGSQMNALGLSSHIMAARIGYNPEVILNSLKGRIGTAKPNFLILDGNHGLEKTTPIEVINSMMLQTIDSVIYLFPNWINKPASFTRLRTKGAFLVTSEKTGATIVNLSVYSENGTTCKLKNPWTGTKLVVTETIDGTSTVISAISKNDIYTFATKKGANYTFDIATGMQHIEKTLSSFSIFPNPTSSFVKVLFSEKTKNQNRILKITNVQGMGLTVRKIEKNTIDVKIDISNYPSGVYFVSCNGESKQLLISKE